MMMTQEPSRGLLVTRKEKIARDIYLFELRDACLGNLPAFSAGAHIAVRVPSGVVRRYSLCNDPQETDRYLIAVKRDEGGRGGSLSLVDDVALGHTVMVGPPVNLFGLSDEADDFILIAGGIGITPMMAMIRALRKEGHRGFKLYYLSRDFEGTAFLDELKSPEFARDVVVHHDSGDISKSFDLSTILYRVVPGTHVYCCGPNPLMDKVERLTVGWPRGAIHFEKFGVDSHAHQGDKQFEVILRQSGLKIVVPEHSTILDALRDRDIYVSTSCENGTCGSCKVGLLEGVGDHRDDVLDADERENNIMVCVSRAKSACLTLDL